MIRKLRNQKEIPTPQTEGWEKSKKNTNVHIPRKHIIIRVSSYFPIGGQLVTRTELKYEHVNKSQTAHKFMSKTQKIEPQQRYRTGTISNMKLLGSLSRFYRRLTSPSFYPVVHNIKLHLVVCPSLTSQRIIEDK